MQHDVSGYGKLDQKTFCFGRKDGPVITPPVLGAEWLGMLFGIITSSHDTVLGHMG